MKKLPLEYQIVTKTYLKPNYLPTYATLVTVVTFVTVVTVVTVNVNVTKLNNSKCDKTQQLICDKTYKFKM